MIQLLLNTSEIEQQSQRRRYAIQLLRKILKEHTGNYEDYFMYSPQGEMIAFSFALQIFLHLNDENLHPEPATYSLPYVKCVLVLIQEVLSDFSDLFHNCYINISQGEYITFETAQSIYDELCDAL